MVKREFTFPSADGKTAIHAVEWLPEGAPRAVLQIAHGVSEYVLRYEDFAGYLTERGFAVVGNDHLGHGLSVSDGAPRLYFGPKGSWNWVVEDMEQLRKLTHRQFPNLPYFLLGHSMGSFLTRTYLIRYPGTVDGAIIMGTGYMSAASTAASLAVINAECLRNGESRPRAVATKASFGIYNRRFAPNRTSMDWLSLNPDNVDAYLKDPLCQGNASAGLFREKFQTLTEQMFYVLLTLREECCGTDVMARISNLTQGRVTVGPGTLYNLLDSFQAAGWIMETKTEGRRRSYLITPAGEQALAEEYQRLQILSEDYRSYMGRRGEIES